MNGQFSVFDRAIFYFYPLDLYIALQSFRFPMRSHEEVSTIEMLKAQLAVVDADGWPLFKFLQKRHIKRKIAKLEFLEKCNVLSEWLASFAESQIVYSNESGLITIDGVRCRVYDSGRQGTRDFVASDSQREIVIQSIDPKKDAGRELTIRFASESFACHFASFAGCSIEVHDSKSEVPQLELSWSGDPLDSWPQCLEKAQDALSKIAMSAGGRR
jgi:hypothetical protein